MSRIVVRVAGEPAAGATTVALLIAKHLASHGLSVEVEDEQASATMLYNGEQERVKALVDKKTHIAVRTVKR